MHCKDARLLQLQFLIKTYNNNNNNNNVRPTYHDDRTLSGTYRIYG